MDGKCRCFWFKPTRLKEYYVDLPEIVHLSLVHPNYKDSSTTKATDVLRESFRSRHFLRALRGFWEIQECGRNPQLIKGMSSGIINLR